MILGKDTLRLSLYTAIIAVLLALTNLYDAFARREVITDTLNLSQFLLGLTLFVAGFIASRKVMSRGILSATFNGALAGAIVGTVLSAVVLITSSIDMRFVFRNLPNIAQSTLALGQENLVVGAVMLIALGALLGGVAGAMHLLPGRWQQIILGAVGTASIIGVLQGQIDKIITLGDAVAVVTAFALAYLAARTLQQESLVTRILVGIGIGLSVALVFGGLAVFTGMERDTILRGSVQLTPTILMLPLAGSAPHLAVFAAVFGLLGAIGATLTRAPRNFHNAAWYLMAIMLMLGVLSSQRGLSVLYISVIAGIMGLALTVMPSQATLAETLFSRLRSPERKGTTRFSSIATLLVLLILPGFIGPSLSNTFNLMMIYIIMGVGMNVMIGFAGLLDLGYVASFAIGAYTTGILTTPSLVTCGGMDAAAIEAAGLTVQSACTGVMTFWQAWPFAIVISALTGMALGVPVLRLRGDYLAIVTLGFGEIIQRILVSSTFKPVFGGAQGIANIPVPTLDLTFLNPAWSARLASSTDIYYLFLFTVILVSIVVTRLINTRLGRAWRALRDDEDVAEAMGIHLVGAKLLAFGISSAFSGMGGALFGASLQGIFPNSFTLLVSINVLSLVIVGGMGAIPGVFIGALMLIGLPEVLRELQDYRLLAFGVLLVVAMLSRPQGLIPPQPPKLSEQSTASKQAAAAAGD